MAPPSRSETQVSVDILKSLIEKVQPFKNTQLTATIIDDMDLQR